MPIICPAVLAENKHQYKEQIDKIANLGHRIQVDLTDSSFAPSKTVSPADIWWPAGFKADIHLMYQDPLEAVKEVLNHQPHMVIIHAEADGNFDDVVKLCRDRGVKLGVALLAATSPSHILASINKIDHVLIFSGELGSYGGHANLAHLEKVEAIKKTRPDIEVGWDGGVNLQNVAEIVAGGVEVLDVGGYIQNAPNPEKAYNDLFRIADETGTT